VSTESSARPGPPAVPGARRREVLAATAATAGAGVLAACQAPGQSAAPRLDEREVTLTYLTDWTSGARGEWVKQALPRFTQEHPKIKVQVENATGSLQTVLLASAAGGTLQDVFNNENDVFQKLARQGDMQDIAPVLKSLSVGRGRQRPRLEGPADLHRLDRLPRRDRRHASAGARQPDVGPGCGA
jgi:Bacterial extracellular solute-binding protein